MVLRGRGSMDPVEAGATLGEGVILDDRSDRMTEVKW